MYNSHIFLAVWMITYNHEKYIEDAIISVINQKTNFNFKLFIGEDFSTDNTREIIKQYHRENPEIIDVIYNKENLSTTKNAINIYKECLDSGAKYIAMLEGDDYWTDPYKLQKQVDFLEANPDYGMVCTDYDIMEDEIVREKYLFNKHRMITDEDIDIEKYILKPFKIRTLTVCLRNNLLKQYLSEIDFQKFNIGDVPMWCYIGFHSKIKYIPISTSMYRINEGTASRPKKLDKKYLFSKKVIETRKYFAEKYKLSKNVNKRIQREYNTNELIYAYLNNDRKTVNKYFLKMILNLNVSPKAFLLFTGNYLSYINKYINKKYNF